MNEIEVENHDIYNILKQKYINVKNFNEEYLIWYVTYMYHANLESKLENRRSENHHFMPAGDFPEYINLIKNKSNKVILRSRDHFIAHYLLFKAAPTKVNTFAFNQMKRVLDKNDRSDIELGSRLYEEGRIEINKMLSTINVGRKPTDKTREAMSKRTKGKVIVYDINDPLKRTFQTETSNPKYISGEYVFLKTGTKHSLETINKMIENSGITNKIPYYHKMTKLSKYFGINDVIPEDFIKGASDETKLACSIRISGLKYYYNPITNEQGRFYDNNVPNGWIHGKPYFGKNGNPFATNKIYRNFITNETGMMLLDAAYPKYCGHSSIKVESRYAYMYKNYVTFNAVSLEKISEYPSGLILTAVKRIKFKTEHEQIRLGYVHIKFKHILKNFNTYADLGITAIKIPQFFELPNYEQYEWIG